MGESRRKRKTNTKREHELLKKKLAELEELQVELKFTALNSKLTLIEHYQEPKGVNYR